MTSISSACLILMDTRTELIDGSISTCSFALRDTVSGTSSASGVFLHFGMRHQQQIDSSAIVFTSLRLWSARQHRVSITPGRLLTFWPVMPLNDLIKGTPDSQHAEQLCDIHAPATGSSLSPELPSMWL